MGGQTALVVGGVIIAGSAIAYYAVPEFKAGVDQAWADFGAWLDSLGEDPQKAIRDNLVKGHLERYGNKTDEEIDAEFDKQLADEPKPKPTPKDPCAGFNISSQCVAKTGTNWVLFKNGNGCWRNKGCNGKISQLCLTKKNIGTMNTQQALNKLAAAWLSVYGCKKASMARSYLVNKVGTART